MALRLLSRSSRVKFGIIYPPKLFYESGSEGGLLAEAFANGIERVGGLPAEALIMQLNA